MNEREKQIEQKIVLYRFWLFAALTAFLVVTFILYLPLRFQHQAAMPNQGEEPSGMIGEVPGAHHGESRYHEEGEVREGLAVNLNVTPVPVAAGTTTRLDFFVNEKPGNVPVRSSELEIEHTKLMHVIGVRNDMNEFFHIHPQPTGVAGLLSVDYGFVNPGRYKMWSSIKKDDITHTLGHPEINVEGGGARSQKNVSFARNVIVGDYQVALHLPQSVSVRRETELLFDAHTLDSQEAELEPYLAADMHLAVIKDDLKQFLHTHPVGNNQHSLLNSNFAVLPEALANGGGHDTNEGGHGVLFRVSFPEPGLYKLFAQFRPLGANLPPDEALLASFWIQVQEKAPIAVSEWMLAAVSLALIAILGLAVKKYLNVPRGS